MPTEQSDPRRQKTENISRYPFPSSNMFEVLSNEIEDDEHISAADLVIKIPPIIIHKTDNFQLLIKNIKSVVSQDLTT